MISMSWGSLKQQGTIFRFPQHVLQFYRLFDHNIYHTKNKITMETRVVQCLISDSSVYYLNYGVMQIPSCLCMKVLVFCFCFGVMLIQLYANFVARVTKLV